jgi:hypothetical protein
MSLFNPENHSDTGQGKSGEEGAGPEREGLGGEAKRKDPGRESANRGELQVPLRPSDLEAVQKRGRNLRAPMTAGDVVQGHLHRSLIRRIETGDYSPRKLILEVGQKESGGKAVGPSRERKELTIVMDRSHLAAAVGRVNDDLLLWIGEVENNGSLLSAPLCRCTEETVVRAAGREIAEGEEVFSQNVRYPASDLRPKPGTPRAPT